MLLPKRIQYCRSLVNPGVLAFSAQIWNRNRLIPNVMESESELN